MAPVLQVGDRMITATELVSLLSEYQILHKLVQEIIIDQAIDSFTCTPQEQAVYCQSFYMQKQLTSDLARKVWLQSQGISPEQLVAMATRQLRIEKFKQATWGHKLESYFLNRKAQLDRVIYSLIRTQDKGIAQELYFRLQAKEQTFAELASTYSQGPEAQTQGLTGPIEMGKLPPALARLLSKSQPGQIWSPIVIDGWFVLVRLEKLIPAKLDESMRQQLLHEKFEAWLQEQLSQLRVETICSQYALSTCSR